MTRVGDMKHGLTSDRPKMSLLGDDAATHQVRATEYGADKYARGNYYGPAPAGVSPVDRFLGYIDATMRHCLAITKAVNIARGTGGDEVAACRVIDDKASGNFPPSLLPHVAHMMASTAIGIETAVRDGLLPADPGQPWKQHPMYAEVLARRGPAAGSGLPQKDDPDAERRRVQSGYNAPSNGVPLAEVQDAPTRPTTPGSRVVSFLRQAGIEMLPEEFKAVRNIADDCDTEGEWAILPTLDGARYEPSKRGMDVSEILDRYPGAAAAAMAALGGDENLQNLKAELAGQERPFPEAYERMHEAMRELDRKRLERDQKWLSEFATLRT
jgi:hypothetical protein